MPAGFGVDGLAIIDGTDDFGVDGLGVDGLAMSGTDDDGHCGIGVDGRAINGTDEADEPLTRLASCGSFFNCTDGIDSIDGLADFGIIGNILCSMYFP